MNDKKDIEKKMKSLGVYKPEFEPVIERYVNLREEYNIIYARYSSDGYQCEIDTSSGSKKSPTVSTLEALRKDMLNLEESLGLTPRGLLKLNEKAFEKAKKAKADELV